MKYAVIDIGSNSVRMLINGDGASIFKESKITKLAKGMFNGVLDGESINRTLTAVKYFVDKSKDFSVDKLFCFATAATRNAKNKNQLIDEIKRSCNIEVDVVSGELEGYIGALGALEGKDGAVIDVGGASSEICVLKQGVKIYSKSLPMGAVSMTDKFGQDKDTAYEFISQKVREYGEIDCCNFYAIGGTASTLSAIEQCLEPYDSSKVHGYEIRKENINEIIDKLFVLSIEERCSLKGLQPERAEVIAQGGLIIFCIMEYLNIDSLIVSESDNLEGYLLEKIKGNE